MYLTLLWRQTLTSVRSHFDRVLKTNCASILSEVSSVFVLMASKSRHRTTLARVSSQFEQQVSYFPNLACIPFSLRCRHQRMSSWQPPLWRKRRMSWRNRILHVHLQRGLPWRWIYLHSLVRAFYKTVYVHVCSFFMVDWNIANCFSDLWLVHV